MTFLEHGKVVLEHGKVASRKGYDLVTRSVRWGLGLLDLLVDVIYDRLDLWQNKERRIASFKKIRSTALYSVVVGVIVYVVSHSFGKPPVEFLTIMLLAMLAASFGENVLMAFFEVLARRWGARPSSFESPPRPSGDVTIPRGSGEVETMGPRTTPPPVLPDGGGE